jgi:protein-arginine kinase activator protein McsA
MSHLSEHIKIVHEKPEQGNQELHQCTICSKSFSQMSSMRRHIRTQCYKTFYGRNLLMFAPVMLFQSSLLMYFGKARRVFFYMQTLDQARKAC